MACVFIMYAHCSYGPLPPPRGPVGINGFRATVNDGALPGYTGDAAAPPRCKTTGGGGSPSGARAAGEQSPSSERGGATNANRWRGAREGAAAASPSNDCDAGSDRSRRHAGPASPPNSP